MTSEHGIILQGAQVFGAHAFDRRQDTLITCDFCLVGTVQLSGLMGDTAKRAVESTNVPQLMTALRGRVELAEERLNNMADKSFRALEEELTGVRSEVREVFLVASEYRQWH